MLKCKDLVVNYGDLQVLHGISLHVEEGEIITLIGSNGAGKSTLLKTISGTLPVKSGELTFKGKSIAELGTIGVVKEKIAHVPESRRLFPHMTVKENLYIGAYLGDSWNQRKQRIEYVYSLFPKLLERRNQAAGTLSGGEQQMVAIGRALMSSPHFLMLDEPSLGLAPNIVDSVFELIQKLNREGITILLIEQNAQMALSISHRAYILENGKLVMEGKSSDLVNDPHVKLAYLGL